MANGKQKNQHLAEIPSPGVTGNESPFLSDSSGTDKPPRAGRGLEPALEDVLETPRGAGGPADAARCQVQLLRVRDAHVMCAGLRAAGAPHAPCGRLRIVGSGPWAGLHLSIIGM